MKAIVLAAGYATRLYPLTKTVAKPLLPVGGRPMIDYLLDRIQEVDEVDAVHVVTNHKFADSFLRWAETHEATGIPIDVHDDGTTSEDDRLGAIGDIRFVIEQAGLEGDDLLVVAGDNLFDYSVADYVRWWRGKGEASAVALYDVGDFELVKKYSAVELDGDDRLVGFVEKPEHPETTLVATATYLFHRAHVPLVERYLEEGNSPDQPGRFVAWLVPRAPVHGYRFEGEWRDIGDAEQLLEADNRLRERGGLPLRDSYSLV
ncbi:MAG: Nucleoside-diphosphate-sugar pyrophosphorylase [Actinomycetia bacterium]|nr:Nucleoside-diphosphate-sugar pyrophosphorylase [Actinomycetes bacterium]